jgi:hypothetical protein
MNKLKRIYENIPFTIALPPKIKYLGINLTKDVKMTSTRRTTNHLRKRSRNTAEDGKIPNLMDWQNQHSKSGCTIRSNLTR